MRKQQIKRGHWYQLADGGVCLVLKPVGEGGFAGYACVYVAGPLPRGKSLAKPRDFARELPAEAVPPPFMERARGHEKLGEDA